MQNNLINSSAYTAVHSEIVRLLDTARQTVARSVNAVMAATYWEIGRRIVAFEQGGQDRAAYGEAVIERLAADLTDRFGRGFSRQNLWQMRSFYQAWSDVQILQTVSGNFVNVNALAKAFPLPWSAYVRLLSVKNEVARRFYENYALEGLPNTVLDAEYQTVLPNEQLLADEIERTQQALGVRRLEASGGDKE